VNLLLDTDVLIYFLRGDKKVRPIFALHDRFYYSYVTRKELLKKPGLSRKEREAIDALLNRMRQVPVDGVIASSAETLRKRYGNKGLQIADALIAATALSLQAVLVTFNRKHYQAIEGLKLFPIENLPDGGLR
jgi:predicted nucleic acid-binding protein